MIITCDGAEPLCGEPLRLELSLGGGGMNSSEDSECGTRYTPGWSKWGTGPTGPGYGPGGMTGG